MKKLHARPVASGYSRESRELMKRPSFRFVPAAGMLRQAPLALGDERDHDTPLRDAYVSVPELARRGISFERAIADDVMRRCLANIAEARLRARAKAMNG